MKIFKFAQIQNFLQLYELSDDVKRKEWLDDWLGFMHRIGKFYIKISELIDNNEFEKKFNFNFLK